MSQTYDTRTFAGLPPQGDEPIRDVSRRHISAYFPSRATVAKSPQLASFLKGGLFVFFIMTRALHPLLIDFSKTEGKILYAKNTPVAMNKVLTVLLMNGLAFMLGGKKGVRMCWQPQCLAVFGIIGTIYALGDFLEMLSMSSLSGGVYQVLLQTKLLITALMIWWLKGSKQSSLQWHVLFAMFLAMSSFVLVDMGSSAGGSGSLPLGGVACTLLKVAVSCYCAVLSEKYLKQYADMPLFAKISGLSTTWAIASMMLCMTEKQVSTDGFFAHWDTITWMVTISFVVKTVSTMYLLQALDSVQKNIGEALAVIVIYAAQVAFPSMDKSFELSVFLLAVLVVALVRSYLLSGQKAAPKAEKGLAKPAKRIPSKRAKIVALNPEGTGLMNGLGLNTIRCELAEEGLPEGVFYGMLGDIHPVCGSTNPGSKTQCELMLLSEAPNAPQGERTVPYMPTQSLTVLGSVRDSLPREKLTFSRFEQDCDLARQLLVERCAA